MKFVSGLLAYLYACQLQRLLVRRWPIKDHGCMGLCHYIALSTFEEGPHLEKHCVPRRVAIFFTLSRHTSALQELRGKACLCAPARAFCQCPPRPHHHSSTTSYPVIIGVRC